MVSVGCVIPIAAKSALVITLASGAGERSTTVGLARGEALRGALASGDVPSFGIAGNEDAAIAISGPGFALELSAAAAVELASFFSAWDFGMMPMATNFALIRSISAWVCSLRFPERALEETAEATTEGAFSLPLSWAVSAESAAPTTAPAATPARTGGTVWEDGGV
jgi:hypothetical protein